MKIQEMNEIVGEKIKNLRKSRNLSQEEVAEFLHVSQSTYARIESGASNSWAGYILPICEFFGIQPEELLKTDHIVSITIIPLANIAEVMWLINSPIN
jgi:DNA-binding helix-turn-helix protein